MVTGAGVEPPIALVTGASRGIGAAVARTLSRRGVTVVLTARSSAPLEELAGEIHRAGGQASAFACDISERESLTALMAHVRQVHGRLDIMVNNAGVRPQTRRLEATSWDEWDAAMATNLAGPWYLACRAKELMGYGGVIVNITSTAAYYPTVGFGLYNISKAAVTMLTRCAALEWARDGIRVVGIAPGLTETEMGAPILDYYQRHDQTPNPLNRVAAPEEIADLIDYVASGRAGFVTGSTFTIDGGELLSTSNP